MSNHESTTSRENQLQNWLGTSLSLGLGAAIWFAIRVGTGENDPESHVAFWHIGYPAMVASSLLMGYVFDRRPWRWGIYIIAAQLFIGALLVKGDLNLLPIGLIFRMADAVPCIIAAYFGSWASRWWKKRRNLRLKGS